jgi:hypothetical protein
MKTNFYKITQKSIFLVIFAFVSIFSEAQTISYPTFSRGMTRGLDSTLTTVRIDFPTSAVNTVKIKLGFYNNPGIIEYIPGSINRIAGTAGINIVESNITDLQNPIFTVNATTAGNFIEFNLKRRANCGTATSSKDVVEVSGTFSYTEATTNVNAYALRAPSLTLVQPSIINNVNLGVTYTRNISVTNGSNGCLDTLGFWIKYANAGFQLVNLSIGATVLTPFFQNADSAYYKVTGAIAFGADKVICNGETVTFTETTIAKKCNTVTNYGAEWYSFRNNTICGSALGQSIITMSNDLPNLVSSIVGDPTTYNDYCVNAGAHYTQKYKITNNGAGAASNIIVDFRAYAPSFYYDTTVVWNVKNSAGTIIGTVANFTGQDSYPVFYTSNCTETTAYQTYLTGAISSNVVLAGGDFLTFEISTIVNNIACPFFKCNSIAFYTGGMGLKYQSQCGNANFTESITYKSDGGATGFGTTLEAPLNVSAIAPNNSFNLDFAFNYYNYNHLNETGVTKLIIPLAGTGLSTSATSVVVSAGYYGPYTWPVTVVNDTVFISLPQRVYLYGLTMSIPFVEDCSDGGGVKTLNVYAINKYSSCSDYSTIGCFSKDIIIHCPVITGIGACITGGATPLNFSLKRINFGLPDNNGDRLPDASGSLNIAALRLDRSVNGDTLQGKWDIKIFPNIDNTDPNFGANLPYVYIDMNVNGKDNSPTKSGNLTALSNASVKIYPVGGGAVKSCTVTPTITSGGSIAHYEIGTGCRAGNFQAGDSIVVKANYIVNAFNGDIEFDGPGSDNNDNGIFSFVTKNEVYAAYTQKTTAQIAPIVGQTYTCDHYNEINEIQNISFANYVTEGTINGCSNLIHAVCYTNIGIFQGKDMFPNEYRNFFIPKQLKVTILHGAKYRPNTAYYNNPSFPISNANVVQIADTLYFNNVNEFYTPYGGSIFPTDEEEYGYGVWFSIDPICSENEGYAWGANATKGYGNGLNTPATLFSGGTFATDPYPYAYLYNAPRPEFTGGGTIQSTDGTASWNVALQNLSNSISAAYNYVYFPTVNTLTNIVLKEGGTVITPDANGFYQLGSLDATANRLLTITAETNTCAIDSIKLSHGWNCTGYPTSVAQVNCGRTLWLKINNYESQIQLSITKQPDPIVNNCSGETLDFIYGSSQAAFADDPTFSLTPPTGLSFTQGQIEYPLGSGNWQTIAPTVVAGIYSYAIENHTQVAALWGSRGLPGTIDNPSASARQAKLRITYAVDCDYANGSTINARINGMRGCGQPISNAMGNDMSLNTNPITMLPTLVCLTGDTNYTVAPQTGNIEWRNLNWSLGHVPTPCESAQITYTGTGATTETVIVNVTTNVRIKNLILLNKSTSTTHDKVFKTIVAPGINMYMKGNVTMSSSAVRSQDSCIFNTTGSASPGLITVTGNTEIGYPADNGYCIFGAVPNATNYYNYWLQGNLTFNAKGLNRAKFTNITMYGKDSMYITNNTNPVTFPNAVMFDKLTFGNASNSPTIIFAGTNQNNYVNDNAGFVEVKNASKLILNENYTLNGTATFNTSFNLRENATLILRGNDGGQTGSNFPKNFSSTSISPTSTVNYDGKAFNPNSFEQTVYATTYGNLLLSISSGTGRAKKKTTGNLSAATSIMVNPLVDFTLGAIGSTNAGITSTGAFTVSNTAGLYCNANEVTGAGTFTLGNNAYFGTGHPLGITAWGTNTGAMKMWGGRTFTATSDYIYNGNVNQITGLGLPTAVDSLIIQNSGSVGNNIVTSSRDIMANGLINANQGIFDIDNTKLTSNGAGIITSTGGLIKARAGAIELKGTSGVPQTLSGSWFVGKNIGTLINDNTVGFTNSATANDSLLISYALLYGNGRTNSFINTNDNLTLLSRDTGTARFGEIVTGSGNTINGKVNIERYMYAKKSWRLLATPINPIGSPSINTAWRENGSTLTSTGYGTQFTGPAGYTGFDAVSQRVSIKYYNATADNHTDVTNTNNAIANDKGYFVFVRGDRGVSQYGLGSTILRIKGNILTGNQVFSFAPTGKYQSFGNPYPSRINYATVTKVNMSNSFTAWNPNSAGAYNVGAYETYTWNGTDYARPGGATKNYIESGEAVYVSRITTGVSTLTVKESDKRESSALQSRNGVINPTLEVLMYVRDTVGTNTYMADGITMNFDDIYSNQIDNDDVVKFLNASENISVIKNNTQLIVERAPKLQVTDTIRLNISNTHFGPYRFDIDPSNLNYPELDAFLVDKFTNTKTPISLTTLTSINFDIANTAASYANDRFMIVFKTAPTTDFTTISAIRNTNNTVTVNWGIAKEINVVKYEIEQSNDGINFVKINTQTATLNNATNINYSKVDATATLSNNWYRIKAINDRGIVKYSSIAMVNEVKPLITITKPSMTISPNPVVNGVINLHLDNQKAGKYDIQVTNTAGQVLFEQQLNVQTYKVLNVIKLQTVAKGNYILSIKYIDGEKVVLNFVIN